MGFGQAKNWPSRDCRCEEVSQSAPMDKNVEMRIWIDRRRGSCGRTGRRSSNVNPRSSLGGESFMRRPALLSFAATLKDLCRSLGGSLRPVKEPLRFAH